MGRDRLKPDLLLRRRPATPKALLSGKKRSGNLDGAFSLSYPARVAGAKILLADDVYTTGATVNECSRILRKAGAERIEVLTVARSLATDVLL